MDESKPIQENRTGGSRHRHPRHVSLDTDTYANAAQQAVAAMSEPATAKPPHDGRSLRRVGTLRAPRTETPAVLAHGLQQLVIDDNTPRSKRTGTSQPIDVIESQTPNSGARVFNDRSHDIEPPQNSPRTRAVAGTSNQATTPEVSSGVRPRPPRSGTPIPIKRRPVPNRAPQILPNPKPGDLRPHAPGNIKIRQRRHEKTQRLPRVVLASGQSGTLV